MTLTHNFLSPKYNLDSRTDEITGKREYLIPDFGWVPSVTTYIDSITDNTSLQKWKNKVGEEEALKIKIKALRRGTNIHNIAESFLLNSDEWKQNKNPIDVYSFSQVIPILNKNITEINGIEYTLFSKTRKLAGRTDAIIKWNNIPCILDFKTSKKEKKDEYIESYYMQSKLYALMCNEMYNTNIQHICILILIDDSEPQIFYKSIYEIAINIK